MGGDAFGTLKCTDADNDPIGSFLLNTNSTSGVVVVNPSSGAFTVTGAVDGKSFTFTDSDGTLTSAPAMIKVVISAPVDTFAPQVTYNTGAFCADVQAADFDGDGDLDLVAANSGSNTITVLRNHGDGTYAAGTDYATAAGPYDIATANFSGQAVGVHLQN